MYMHSGCVALGVPVCLFVCLFICLFVCLLRVAVTYFVLPCMFALLSEPGRCVIIRRSVCNVIPLVL